MTRLVTHFILVALLHPAIHTSCEQSLTPSVQEWKRHWNVSLRTRETRTIDPTLAALKHSIFVVHIQYAHYFILVVFQIDDSSGWIGYSFPQGWCHRGISRTCFRETLQIPFLNCSIDLLPHQWSKFSMERFSLWRASLVWWGICLWVTVYALILVWFPILDVNITDSVFPDYKHLDIGHLHIWHPKLLRRHPMHLPLGFELLQLIQFFLLLSIDVANGWQCDPWFKRQLKAVVEEFVV